MDITRAATLVIGGILTALAYKHPALEAVKGPAITIGIAIMTWAIPHIADLGKK